MREVVGRDICWVYAASMDAGDHAVAAMPGCPAICAPTLRRVAEGKGQAQSRASFGVRVRANDYTDISPGQTVARVRVQQ
jgi:hypothetical protein